MGLFYPFTSIYSIHSRWVCLCALHISTVALILLIPLQTSEVKSETHFISQTRPRTHTSKSAACLLTESLNSSGNHEGNPDYILVAQPCMSVETGRQGPGETGGCLILHFRGNGIVYRRWINTEASGFCSAGDGGTAESFRCWKWYSQFCFADIMSVFG